MSSPLYRRIYAKPDSQNPYYKHLFARGFLISKEKHIVKNEWEHLEFGPGLHITYDNKVHCEYVEYKKSWVLILGSVMDTIDWHMDTWKIAMNLAQKYNNQGESALFDYVDWLGGRYLIVYGNEREMYALQDATGMRSACFYRHKLLLASHYHIINDIVGAAPHPFVEKYCNMPNRPWLLPGHITPFVDIMNLLANHKIDLTEMKVKRFFPRANHLRENVSDTMDYIADTIRKQMNLLGKHNKLMLSLTKGNDSRISMAAARDVHKDILVYTYLGEGRESEIIDCNYAEMLCKRHGIEHKKIANQFSNEQEEYQMLEVCFHNHYHRHITSNLLNKMAYLPDDRLVVRSNLIEIIRSDYYEDLGANASWEGVAKRVFYTDMMDDPEYCEIMKQYFVENEYDHLFDYHVGDFVFWEYRLGLWVNGAVLLEDDLCFETYMLFNHRKILECGLGIPRYFKGKNALVYEVIERIWPEMMYDLPNTDYTQADYFITDSNGLVELKTGSVTAWQESRKQIIVPYYRLGRFNGIFGYGNALIHEGDRCALTLNTKVFQDGIYTCQISLRLPNEFPNARNIATYSIWINEERCYSENITSFMNKFNQITILKQLKAGNNQIRIQVRANMDHDASESVPVLIQVEHVLLMRQYGLPVPDKTKVLSTSDCFNELRAQLS